ncbi:MAG TPA: hypothetical protein VK184_03570 [Nostocaceae cyanobacterium]|nr:hypothetical protein [Nostocaceae cyanobacterium]
MNNIVEAILQYCQQRSPEKLDPIFDTLPVSIDQLQEIVRQLDTDTLAWFCGYMCSEINHSQDNQKISHPLTALSRLLIQSGMQPFNDFMPYPVCRIIILNVEKFESLPLEIQYQVAATFKLQEASGEEAERINLALLQELTVNS